MAKRNQTTEEVGLSSQSDEGNPPELADEPGDQTSSAMIPEVKAELAPLTIPDDQDFMDVIRAIAPTAEMEVIVAGKTPYWPGNIPKMVCAGRLQGWREIPTRLVVSGVQLKAILHTVELMHPCYAVTPDDGEMVVLPKGKIVTVLERTMLKDLRDRIGQIVFIGCVGKRASKNGFSYYEYKVMGLRQTPQEMQASAQMSMAKNQARMLEQANAPIPVRSITSP
jgi:hypothetical protein